MERFIIDKSLFFVPKSLIKLGNLILYIVDTETVQRDSVIENRTNESPNLEMSGEKHKSATGRSEELIKRLDTC